MKRFFLSLLIFLIPLFAQEFALKDQLSKSSTVVLKTTMGDIVLEIKPEWAPLASENFLQHVKDGMDIVYKISKIEVKN